MQKDTCYMTPPAPPLFALVIHTFPGIDERIWSGNQSGGVVILLDSHGIVCKKETNPRG
jgi:hypothetical protein